MNRNIQVRIDEIAMECNQNTNTENNHVRMTINKNTQSATSCVCVYVSACVVKKECNLLHTYLANGILSRSL